MDRANNRSSLHRQSSKKFHHTVRRVRIKATTRFIQEQNLRICQYLYTDTNPPLFASRNPLHKLGADQSIGAMTQAELCHYRFSTGHFLRAGKMCWQTDDR